MDEKGKCQLCDAEDGDYYVGGPLRYICPRCSVIVDKWEEARKKHMDFRRKLRRKYANGQAGLENRRGEEAGPTGETQQAGLEDRRGGETTPTEETKAGDTGK